MNLRVMRIIGRIMDTQDYEANDKIPRVEPALRLTVAFICVLLCAMSRNAAFVITVIAVETVRLSMMKAETILNILKPVAAASVFTAVCTLPSLFMGSPRTMVTVTMKVFESVMVLAVMNEDMNWKDTINAFRTFRMPQIFVFTLDMTVRFLVILGRYSNSILEAVTLRSVGERNWKNAGTGSVLGMTFLKSQQMAESTSEAMECRCFDGEYRKYGKHRWNLIDLLSAVIVPVLIIFYIYMNGKMK